MSDKTSFLPDDYLEKRVQRRTNIISLSLFAVVMLGVVGAFMVTDRQRAEVRQMQKQVNERFEEAARRIDQMDALQAAKDRLVRKAKVTSMLKEAVPRGIMLSELINNMPSAMGWQTFTLETKVARAAATVQTALDRARAEAAKAGAAAAPEEAQPDPTEVTIQLTGVAPADDQVARFMNALTRNKMFMDVNLDYTEELTIEGHAMRKFRVEMRVNQDVDISSFDPKLVNRLNQNPMDDKMVIDGNKELNDPNKKPPGGVTASPVKQH